MERELIKFCLENNLSPFSKEKPKINQANSIYKTKDAKAVHARFLSVLSKNFVFPQTPVLFSFFHFTQEEKEIIKRQEFFNSIKPNESADFLKKINSPRPFWKPDYSILIVTESGNTFTKLKELGCPVKIIISENDLYDLENIDIVQAIDCENFSRALESLPNVIQMDSLDEIYLERYFSQFSGWLETISILKENCKDEAVLELLDSLEPLSSLISEHPSTSLSFEAVESALNKINRDISSKLKEMTLSGESLLDMLNKKSVPREIKDIINNSIKESGFPDYLFIKEIPVSIDEETLNKKIAEQNSKGFLTKAEKIAKNAKLLLSIPEKLRLLGALLLVLDFKQGISKLISDSAKYPSISDSFKISEAENSFLDTPQPISFHLNMDSLCSILTGANSGGKTTLLEHIIQVISSFQLGLPLKGSVSLPIFSEIYYFAKTKGSSNRGAFETLLAQMSEISPGAKTLILADEIEAVTEPGVAGKIIAATAEYFIKQGCFLVIATHLGNEIQKVLPEKARIDGIEAKGLTENNELIVDHNPVLGRLAHSTPELIVEKMARSSNKDYFDFINNYLKSE